MANKRQNTTIETEGAEFLVLGNLLIQGISAYKTYTNFPGYDIVAVNPDRGISLKIQVKSRWPTNASGFIIKSFDCDHIVLVKLNRGNKMGTGKIKEPEFFIFPKNHIENLPRTLDLNKVPFKAIPDFDCFKDRWDLIKAALKFPT